MLKRKTGNLKSKNEHVLALLELSSTFKHSSRHMALSRLAIPAISLLRNLDIEAYVKNVYFDNMVSQINLSELQLNKASPSDTKAAFKTCICLFLMI